VVDVVCVSRSDKCTTSRPCTEFRQESCGKTSCPTQFLIMFSGSSSPKNYFSSSGRRASWAVYRVSVCLPAAASSWFWAFVNKLRHPKFPFFSQSTDAGSPLMSILLLGTIILGSIVSETARSERKVSLPVYAACSSGQSHAPCNAEILLHERRQCATPLSQMWRGALIRQRIFK
jgi:hypothetical protein